MEPQWETTLFCFVCDHCEDGSEQSYLREQGVELALLADLARSLDLRPAPSSWSCSSASSVWMCNECIDIVARHGEAARALDELSALIVDRVGDLKLWKWRGESRLLHRNADETAGKSVEAGDVCAEDWMESLRNEPKVIPIHDERVWNILVGEKRHIKELALRKLLTQLSKRSFSPSRSLTSDSDDCFLLECDSQEESGSKSKFSVKILMTERAIKVDRHKECIKAERNTSSFKRGERNIFYLNKREFEELRVCEFCCKSSESEADANSHVQTHGRNKHALTHHSRQACQYSAESPTAATSKAERTRFGCQQCSKAFVSKRNLKQHLKVVHDAPEETRVYSCSECPRRFHKRSNLENHVVRHSDLRGFECDEVGCGKRFKREKTLRQHRATQHAAGHKPSFLCVVCGKSFESLSGMKQHMEKHTGVEYVKRKVACATCSKSFRSEADLRIHSVVHSKEKPFQCGQCGAAFSQKASWKDHLNVHLSTYQCSFCHKSFGRQRYLDQHSRTCNVAKLEMSDPGKDEIADDSLKLKQSDLDFQDINQSDLAADDGFATLASNAPSVCDTINLMDACMEDKVVVSMATESGSELVTEASSEDSRVLEQLTSHGAIAMLEYTASEDEEVVAAVFSDQDQAQCGQGRRIKHA